jgi:type I restriction enzyme R subunit
MGVLRNPEFIDLLTNYPRPPRFFLRAPDVADNVTSEYLIRGSDGREYKPDDYLLAFASFVQENEDNIAALSILAKHPADWSGEVLAELLDALRLAGPGFTVRTLQEAHARAGHRALADVISIVKHGLDEASDLLTAEERVDRAVGALVARDTLSDEQQAWLSHIRESLVANLSIGRDDFELMPSLARRGGWGRAARVFGGEAALDQLLDELNGAIAA